MYASSIKYILALAGTLLLHAVTAHAQYAPQAGVAGSDAIARSSSAIKGWATGCRIQRGLQQMGNPAGGYVSAGDSSLALGPADGMLVSLGDSGIATLTFTSPLVNGPGPDFAVFENGFPNPSNNEEAFLELAFVAVSSDGVNFFRFPAASLTQDTAQISSVVNANYMNARLLHNLAGKHISGWGTPFDLQELDSIPGLNISRITHVRIIDAIGSVGPEGMKDADGRAVNDPFPTAFPTGGFDLDAVGILNSTATGIGTFAGGLTIQAYPNPVQEQLYVSRSAADGDLQLSLADATGRVLIRDTMRGTVHSLSLTRLAAGVYYLSAQNGTDHKWVGKITRH